MIANDVELIPTELLLDLAYLVVDIVSERDIASSLPSSKVCIGGFR